MAAYFWYFMIYSFLGFGLEVLFARATGNPKRDRKCLYFLPLCPVYGLGAVLILRLPPAVRAQPLLLYPSAALAATAAEYAVDLFCQRVLGVRFWDYSALPMNLKGRVCLLFSLIWGGLALGLIYAVHPGLTRLVAAIPGWATVFAAAFLALDGGFTVYVLRRSGTTRALRWYADLTSVLPLQDLLQKGRGEQPGKEDHR